MSANPAWAEANTPGSTSNTISIASFQKGTMVFKPVRLKSSSIKSSDTSQKYSWPGREQNQLIHVSVEVGVEDAGEAMNAVCPWQCPGMGLTVPILYFIHYVVCLAIPTYNLLFELDLILDLLLGPRHGKVAGLKHPSFLDRVTIHKFRLRVDVDFIECCIRQRAKINPISSPPLTIPGNCTPPAG